MSSLDRAIERKMASVTEELAARLYDSPLPSVDDIRQDIAVIKAFVKDIKSEVKNIEVNQPNTNNPRSETEDKDESSDTISNDDLKNGPGRISRQIRDRIADWLEDNYRDRIHPSIGEDNLLNDLLDTLRGNDRLTLTDLVNIIALFYFDRFFDPFDLLNDARQLVPQVQMIRADLAPKGPLARVIEDYNRTTNELVDLVGTLTMTRVEEVESLLSEQLSDSVGTIIADIASLRSFNEAYLPTIYDKIVECCVVNDVQELLTLANHQSDDIREVLSILRSGGSPALLSQNGAILSGLKSIQAELSQIRGLL